MTKIIHQAEISKEGMSSQLVRKILNLGTKISCFIKKDPYICLVLGVAATLYFISNKNLLSAFPYPICLMYILNSVLMLIGG